MPEEYGVLSNVDLTDEIKQQESPQHDASLYLKKIYKYDSYTIEFNRSDFVCGIQFKNEWIVDLKNLHNLKINC